MYCWILPVALFGTAVPPTNPAVVPDPVPNPLGFILLSVDDNHTFASNDVPIGLPSLSHS